MGVRKNLAQTIRKIVRDFAANLSPPVTVLRHGTIRNHNPDDPEWLRVDLLNSTPQALAGGKPLNSRKKDFFIFQVSAFSRYAEDRADGNALRSDDLADQIRDDLFGGKSIVIQNLDTTPPGGSSAAPNFQGYFQCDDGQITQIPEDSRDPGVFGYAVSFNCEVFPLAR